MCGVPCLGGCCQSTIGREGRQLLSLVERARFAWCMLPKVEYAICSRCIRLGMSAYLVGLCLAPFVIALVFVLAFVFAFTSFCACLCLSALALLGIFLHGFLRPCLFLPYPPPPPLRPTPIFEIARRSSADRDLRVQCFFTYGTSENKRVKIAS